VSSVGEDFPKQQARVRDVLEQFKKIGPAGAIGAALIEHSLRQADDALASGDVLKILVAYDGLRKIEGNRSDKRLPGWPVR